MPDRSRPNRRVAPQAAEKDLLRRQIDESLRDPRPTVPADTVFRRLRTQHKRRLKKSPTTA